MDKQEKEKLIIEADEDIVTILFALFSVSDHDGLDMLPHLDSFKREELRGKREDLEKQIKDFYKKIEKDEPKK